ncbi:MAG TPA: FecR family protein [Puia sp.]|jgi:ferric-dicitrate binding protein FerR (iron transport regulator)|nr:FecR family protein [Puia sp.]
MDQDKIWTLLAKKLSGEATASELTELEAVLRANPNLHYSLQPLIDLWQTDTSPDKAIGKQAFDRHLQRMDDLGVDFSATIAGPYSLPSASRRKNIIRITAIAIPLLTLAIITGRLLFFQKNTPRSYPAAVARQTQPVISEITTRNGSKTSLILPDGTKVWLNAGSKLTYDSTFGKIDRKVSLSGEGYFDVVRNKQQPFIIHAATISIKVLGTEFDVRSYPSDKTTEASLIRGSIEVIINAQPNKKVILKPNEKLIIDNFRFENHLAQTTDNAAAAATSVPDIAKDITVRNLTHENKTGEVIETSWVENKLVFQDESFEEIARKLERWYGVTIRFNNERLKDDHLTGTFMNETIRQALDALKFTATFNYSVDNDNNITIY